MVKNNRYIMVMFYHDWLSTRSNNVRQEYAAAAIKLKGEIILAKVNAWEEYYFAEEFNIPSYPALLFFMDDIDYVSYNGPMTK